MGIYHNTIVTLTVSETFSTWDFVDYLVHPHDDAQSTCEILYRSEFSICISELSGYVCCIEVKSNRDDVLWRQEANRPGTCRDTKDGEILRN